MSSTSIKPEHKAIAKALSEMITINGKEGSVTVGEGAYASQLPEGITMETVDKVREYDARFVAASALAFGEASIQAYKANSDLKTNLVATFPMGGKNDVTHTVVRSKEFSVPSTGATVNKTALMTVLTAAEGVTNKGALKAIRDYIADEGKAAGL